jgi:hypothetical protein
LDKFEYFSVMPRVFLVGALLVMRKRFDLPEGRGLSFIQTLILERPDFFSPLLVPDIYEGAMFFLPLSLIP